MEHFIEKVRYYPYLWDVNHTSYRDIVKKDMAWEIISKECGLANGQVAKCQWKRIRDSHREALRRRRTSTGRAVHNVRPWKYETSMEFLLPLAQNRPNDTEESTDAGNTTDTNNVTEVPSSPSQLPLMVATMERKHRNQNQCCNKSISKVVQQREEMRQQQQNKRDELRNNAIDNSRISSDALSNLFASFCQKTRELPKYLQLRVQREIFETVTRAEEEALSIDSINIPSTSASLYGYARTRNYEDGSLPDHSLDSEHRSISISPKVEEESDSMSEMSNCTQP